MHCGAKCIHHTFTPIIKHLITTLLPSVNTLIARGMSCGAKYTHHTFTPIIKHLITTLLPSMRNVLLCQVHSSHVHSNHKTFHKTLNYNCIAKCQYTDCTGNVLWCQVHSSHIHSNHKTLNYNFIAKHEECFVVPSTLITRSLQS